MPRSLTATVAAAIMLVATACGSGSGDRPRADLGQTRIVLAAAASGGGAATPEALAQASEVLARRFTDAGLPDPLAELTDSGLVVTVAGEADEQLVRSLVVPGELRFRKVLAVDEQFGSSVPPPPAPVPLDDQRTRREREAAVTEKVGEAAMAAVQSFVEREPADRYANELRTALEAFQALTPAEVAVLPATFQFHVSKIGCGRLNARPHGAVLETQQVVAACDDTPTKYLLDAAAVTGANVADAEASLESTAGQWVVTLSFTEAGQDRWTALTQEAVWNSGEPFDPAALGPADRYQGPVPIRCEPAGGGNCRVAVVLDNAVITAAQITDVITGPAQVTGNFTENQAQRLATQLRFGPLPLVLTVESVESQPPAG